MTRPIRVLALDLGRRTGWAIGEDGARVDSGVHELYAENKPSRVWTDGERFREFFKFLVRTYTKFEYDVIAFEQVSGGTKGRQTQLYNGFRAVVAFYSERWGMPCFPVAVGSAKKALTGSGKASKEDMVHAANRMFGVGCFSDDEADALGVMTAIFDDWEETGKPDANRINRKSASGKVNGSESDAVQRLLDKALSWTSEDNAEGGPRPKRRTGKRKP